MRVNVCALMTKFIKNKVSSFTLLLFERVFLDFIQVNVVNYNYIVQFQQL